MPKEAYILNSKLTFDKRWKTSVSCSPKGVLQMYTKTYTVCVYVCMCVRLEETYGLSR